MARKRNLVSLPEHVHAVTAKGRIYYYYQPNRGSAVKGERTKLPGDPQSVEFWHVLKDLSNTDLLMPGPRAGTIAALIKLFKQDPEFKNLANSTRKQYARYLNIIDEKWGDLGAKQLRAKHVLALRNKYSETPRAANYLIFVLSVVMNYGMPLDYWTKTHAPA